MNTHTIGTIKYIFISPFRELIHTK